MKMFWKFQHDKTHNFKFITNIPMSTLGHIYQTLNYFKIITMGTNFIYIVEHVETHWRFEVLTKVSKNVQTQLAKYEPLMSTKC